MLIRHMKNAEKLLEFIPQVDAAEVDSLPAFKTPEAIYAWSANLYIEGRDRILLFVNEFTNTPIVFMNFKAKDRKEFFNEIKDAIRQTFEAYSVDEHFIADYLKNLGEPQRYKLQDRKSVARSNSIMSDLFYDPSCLNCGRPFQEHFITHYKSRIFKDVFGPISYVSYDEFLFGQLAKIDPKLSVKHVDMYVFEFELCVSDAAQSTSRIFRRVQVNRKQTFMYLHKVMQKCMNWMDYHLWNFLILKDVSKSANNSKQPNLRLITPETMAMNNEISYVYGSNANYVSMVRIEDIDEDDLVPEDFGENGRIERLESNTQLCSFFENYNDAIYCYDYGDGWTFKVKLIDKVANCDYDHAKCLDAGGDAPPEDVGGVGGYKQFLDDLKTLKGQELLNLTAWAKSQGFAKLDIAQINRELNWFLG